MRFEAVKAIYEAGKADERIAFITGDYGHALTKEFQAEWRGRYFNAGMSEQNIIGMAAGMALEGMKVFVYSIAPFITLRCYEQIKVDLCDHNVDVTIIGGGGGFAYCDAGPTHWSIEDIGALRLLPRMKVICPATPSETRQLTQQLIRCGGPAYVRIGRGKEADPKRAHTVELGRAAVVRPGEDLTIISTGTILDEALLAADLLAEDGLSAEVLHMHTIKPLDVEAIQWRATSRRALFTMEEHNVVGGLGGAVAEVLAETPGRPIFKRFGVQDAWPEVVGAQAYLRELCGLSASKVVAEIRLRLCQPSPVAPVAELALTGN